MAKKKGNPKEREAMPPRGVGNAVKCGIKAVQETIWRHRFMMLIWATWMTLCSTHELWPVILIVPTSLCSIYLYANLARQCAWSLMLLIWPQWFLSLMLPEERSIKQYGQKYKLMEKHKKHRGGKVIYCSKYGIGVWRGFIEVIIKANDRNKSWGGMFSLQDLRMSGHRCRIKSEPTYPGTDANLLLDLSRLAQLLIGEFSPKNVPIKFVKLLCDDMMMASTLSPAPSKSQFLELLKNHPALKSPRQLTNFTSELFQAYMALGTTDKQKFDTIVSLVKVGDWVKRTELTNDKLLIKVLTYKKYDPNNTESSYDSTSNELFRFLRNFQQHGADSDVTTGAENMFNMKDLEFVATYEYCGFICRLIHQLVVRTDMKSMKLEYAWINYTEY